MPGAAEAHPGPLVTTAAAGEIRIEPLSAADWARIAALTIQYADQHLGGVDSSLIAIAERLGASSIGTLDRRHFGIVRPQHITGFELLP